MVRMAQEWMQQGSNARRRSLESAMKETQARTKVVVRHLPPSLSNVAFQEQIAAKHAGSYTWCWFHPGKSSHKHQVHSRAYINFKKPEDVIDFYEEFNGHVFVNERGAQFKALVEYAPYQRVPKPRSKKDVREGTISKDPEYVAFVEQLAKPTEFLPSAEVQLERREAEKAASLASGAPKDTVIVTPLMEFVRLRRAAKSAPQRGMSASAKLASRSAGLTSANFNLASQKRASEKGRSGPVLYVADNTSANKEVVNHASAPPREEQQRKERETLIERKRKETTEGKEKKLVREAVAAALSSTRANPGSPRVESNKERTILSTKDSLETSPVQILTADGEQSGSRVSLLGKSTPAVGASGDAQVPGDTREASKRDFKRKQVLVAKDKDKESANEVGQATPTSNILSNGSASNQRNRSPASSKVTSGVVQMQQPGLSYRATSPGDSNSTTKQGHRRESGGRTPVRAGVPQSQSQPASSVHGASPAPVSVDPQAPPQQSSNQSERGGKRPPRPQAIRLAGKDQAVSLYSTLEVESGVGYNEEKFAKQVANEGVPSTSLSERQDSRRLRNKDRPDRPVWTPRRREGVPLKADGSVSNNGVTTSLVGTPTSEATPATTQSGTDPVSKNEKVERGRYIGKSGSEVRVSEAHQVSGTGAVASSGSVPSSKLRYVESGGRSARGGRGSSVAGTQDVNVVSQVDVKIDGVGTDGKGQGGKQSRENGETVIQGHEQAQQLVMEDRRKQDGTFWNESGVGHRQGGRRERNGQQALKEGEGGITGADLASKLAKRGRGPLINGSNEKQVWVAVQKTVTGV